MDKYINAEKLKAEIKRLYGEHSSKYGMDETAIVLDKLEDFIDSPAGVAGEEDLVANLKELIKTSDNGCSNLDIARHFYELGLNARKED